MQTRSERKWKRQNVPVEHLSWCSRSFASPAIRAATCFWQEVLLRRGKEELLALAAETQGKDFLAFRVALPLEVDGRPYNVAAVLDQGEGEGLSFPRRSSPTIQSFMRCGILRKGFFPPPEDHPGCRGQEQCPVGHRMFCWPVRNCPDPGAGAAEICEAMRGHPASAQRPPCPVRGHGAGEPVC